MSFSSDVKSELVRQNSKSRHCQLAELAGILELEGRLDEKTGVLTLSSDNELLEEKFLPELVKRLKEKNAHNIFETAVTEDE